MSSFEKYRIHEVAKDFKLSSKPLTSKKITEILTEYVAAPKNHMQVLETPELDVIFDYLTQHNQVGSIEEIFAAPAPAPEPAPAPAASEAGKDASKKKAEQREKNKDDAPAARAAQQQQQPGGGKKQQPAATAAKPQKPKQVAEKRIIDTRGSSSTTTNLKKYDEKFENLAGERG